MNKKINVLHMIREQKNKETRKHQAQLCMLGYYKPEAKR